jgi:hypothetical protein
MHFEEKRKEEKKQNRNIFKNKEFKKFKTICVVQKQEETKFNP